MQPCFCRCSIQTIKDVIGEFYQFSRLKPNLQKSAVFFACVNANLTYKLLHGFLGSDLVCFVSVIALCVFSVLGIIRSVSPTSLT